MVNFGLRTYVGGLFHFFSLVAAKAVILSRGDCINHVLGNVSLLLQFLFPSRGKFIYAEHKYACFRFASLLRGVVYMFISSRDNQADLVPKTLAEFARQLRQACVLSSRNNLEASEHYYFLGHGNDEHVLKISVVSIERRLAIGADTAGKDGKYDT